MNRRELLTGVMAGIVSAPAGAAVLLPKGITLQDITDELATCSTQGGAANFDLYGPGPIGVNKSDLYWEAQWAIGVLEEAREMAHRYGWAWSAEIEDPLDTLHQITS